MKTRNLVPLKEDPGARIYVRGHLTKDLKRRTHNPGLFEDPESMTSINNHKVFDPIKTSA